MEELNKIAPTRDAYGKELEEMGSEYADIVVLEADISKSTRTSYFAKKFPDRFINVGVAEQNEMAIAAGLASCGATPFVSTYSVFASMRACEQIRTFVCYPKLNIKIAVSHGGLTPGSDGVTHQATEDMGIVSTFPNMTVIMPADYYSARKIVRQAYHYKGPVYLRFTRDAVPPIYNGNEEFKIGKANILVKGKDIALIGIGDMVYQCVEAAKRLEKLGISASVVDMHTLKPLAEAYIYEFAHCSKGIITVEDHQIKNGLGSAVSDFICDKYPIFVKKVGLKNTFAESGEYKLLLKKYDMDTDYIVKTAIRLLEDIKK
ncbi:MAG: transketolase family protein [Actinobacteria bacterium]|nr:transketolase family protein [Actinomycetota bacterium]